MYAVLIFLIIMTEKQKKRIKSRVRTRLDGCYCMLTVVEQGQRGGMVMVVVLTCRRRVAAHARLQRIHQPDAVDGRVRRRGGRSLEMVRGGGCLHGRAQ